MGEVVLGTGGALGSLHVYAQCLRDHPGGVALVAINLDRKSAARLTLPFAAERYTLSADALEARSVKLNGRTLALAQDGTLPELRWAAVPRGPLTLAPATISFLAMPTANNADCR